MRKLLNSEFYIPLLLIMSLSTQANSAAVHADNWGGGWHDGWGWGHMFFGSFMMLLFWGGLIILIVLAVRMMGRKPAQGSDGSAQGNRALEILEERFARGEIDKEEFEERKQLLSK